MITRSDSISLFRLLARSLVYPEPGFVGEVQDAVGRVRMELWDDPSLPLSVFIEELGQLAQLPLDKVQGEHTRLFLAAYPHVPCPPYESVYREGQLSGEAAEQVHLLFRRWGLSVEGEEVDHAGPELEFAAFLLSMDTRESIAAANRFLGEHLRAWLPKFASDLARESRLGFYRTVGSLVSSMMHLESESATTIAQPAG